MSFDPWWLSYPLLGAFAGYIAGLFGVGGGLTLVPLLFMLYTAQGFPPEHTMHLALGTSMGTIVFTSIASMRAHHAHGQRDLQQGIALIVLDSDAPDVAFVDQLAQLSQHFAAPVLDFFYIFGDELGCCQAVCRI